MDYKTTLKYIQDKYELDLNGELPIKLPINKHSGLPSLFAELGFKKGVEVGVNKGKFSKWIMHKMRKNKPKLFLVDNYPVYEDFGYYAQPERQKNCHEEAKQRLAAYNCEWVLKPSAEASEDFLDNSLDFVFIDANHHYEFVVEDIAKWSAKIKPGGIISGHDYSPYMFEVKAAVDGWIKSRKIKPWFLTEQNKVWLYVKE